MQSILVINSKGGSGKTTIATNLASFYACWGVQVSLADYDRQHSSTEWLHSRPKGAPKIRSVSAWLPRHTVPSGTEYLIMDGPSGLYDDELMAILLKANTILIPVLPSPLDIRATGRLVHFIMRNYDKLPLKPKVGVVANRAKTQTRIYSTLKQFLNKLNIDFVTSLRDTQNYIAACDGGLGLFEQPEWKVRKDLDGWRELINWVNYHPIFDLSDTSSGQKQSPKLTPMADAPEA